MGRLFASTITIIITITIIVLCRDTTRAFQPVINSSRAAIPRLPLLTILATAADHDSALNNNSDDNHNKKKAQPEQEQTTQTSTRRTNQNQLLVMDPTSPSSSDNHDDVGLYRRFAQHAWERLEKLDYLQDANIDPELQSNQSTPTTSNAKDGSRVHMTIKALTGTNSATSPIRYARYALLETLPSSATTAGIQVLNLVVFPNSNLPVWGADFVSLPGNKHLLLLDAQPMIRADEKGDNGYAQHWEEWYQSHSIGDVFPWGGDLPEKVQPFVSKFALWSRLGGTETSPETIRTMLNGPLYQAYCDHLDRYLQLVSDDSRNHHSNSNIGEYHGQKDYIAYRLANDPARPMLKRLFGEEWTEKVLQNVLFPNS
jgi:Ferredoxin-dependent bilin reductase